MFVFAPNDNDYDDDDDQSNDRIEWLETIQSKFNEWKMDREKKWTVKLTVVNG